MFFQLSFLLSPFDINLERAERNKKLVEDYVQKSIDDYLKTANQSVVEDFGWTSFWSHEILGIRFELTKLVLLVNSCDANVGDYFYCRNVPLSCTAYEDDKRLFKRIRFRACPDVTNVWKRTN